MTIPLKPTNWHEYLNALTLCIYHAGWSEHLIDIDQQDPTPWDRDESRDTREEKMHRRDAYAVVYTQIDEVLTHLREGVKHGDVKTLFGKIRRRFCVKDTGNVTKLRREFETTTMYNTGVAVERFIAIALQRQAHYLMTKGAVPTVETEQMLCSVIIQGLLPDFQFVKDQLSMLPLSAHTLDSVTEQINKFAASRSLMDVHKAAPKNQLSLTQVAGQHQQSEACRNWTRGTCNNKSCPRPHLGPKGKLPPRHDASQAASQQEGKKKGGGPRKFGPGECFECGSKKHLIKDCPLAIKKAAAVTDVKSFMLRIKQADGKSTEFKMSDDLKRAMLLNMAGTTTSRSSRWYSDNAGTQSCTNDIADYVDGSITDAEYQVTVGDGRVITYKTKVGDVLIKPYFLPPFLQKKVIFLPDCPVKISSMRTFDLKGCAAVIFGQQFQIWLPEKNKSHQESLVVVGHLCPEMQLYELAVEQKGVDRTKLQSIPHTSLLAKTGSTLAEISEVGARYKAKLMLMLTTKMASESPSTPADDCTSAPQAPSPDLELQPSAIDQIIQQVTTPVVMLADSFSEVSRACRELKPSISQLPSPQEEAQEASPAIVEVKAGLDEHPRSTLRQRPPKPSEDVPGVPDQRRHH